MEKVRNLENVSSNQFNELPRRKQRGIQTNDENMLHRKRRGI